MNVKLLSKPAALQSVWENTFLLFLFFLHFGRAPWHMGILVPRPGVEPLPPAVEAQSLNHWTAREVPGKTRFIKQRYQITYLSFIHVLT